MVLLSDFILNGRNKSGYICPVLQLDSGGADDEDEDEDEDEEDEGEEEG